MRKKIVSYLKQNLSQSVYQKVRAIYFGVIQSPRILIKKCTRVPQPLFWPFKRMSILLRRASGFFLFHRKLQCPLCECRVEAFIPHRNETSAARTYKIVSGGDVAKHQCPFCDSRPRARLMWLYFKQSKIPQAMRKKTLLHFSPEYMLYERLKKYVGEYHTIDNGASAYEYGFCQNIEAEDMTAMTYQDQSVDYIICNHVLEHILADDKAMAELFRILKKGGVAYLMVPIGADILQTIEDSSITTHEGRIAAFGQWDHVRIYSRADFIARLEKAGFKVTPSRPKITEEDMGRYGCEDKDEEIFVCEKV